jgi:threonyl-tRNA synthetase
LILTKSEALDLFSSNPFKVSLITNKIPEGGKITAYKCGTLIDLCTGPHIPNTGRVKAFKVMKNSSAYWLGKNINDSLQRIYGVSFPNAAELKEYVHFLEEAEKRDHRNIAKAQDLFFFHQMSPGNGFFMPRGTHIYNTLITFMREQYVFREFTEVVTPNLFNLKLWKTSGHYQNYKKNMFLLKLEN